MSETDYLDIGEVVEIHDQMIDRYGGAYGFNGPSGEGLVESAVHRPRNKALYEGADLPAQAASLLFGLGKNHGFLDGNKRIALAATSVFLLLNGWSLLCHNDIVADFIEGCSSETCTEDLVVEFIRSNVNRA
ncbi:MAG TPA: type II toxin-antitoxin system death-on-curing family toxin [Cyanobacteria bacterium UBA8530]|nr:type II toxin-antitoxin system death-on-curing family toxin [Cyanobacteria bacterium UBA8530]